MFIIAIISSRKNKPTLSTSQNTLKYIILYLCLPIDKKQAIMKIFTTQNIHKLDEFTIEHEPISSIDLMERAAKALSKKILERWNNSTPIVVFAGPGNNGGDALAVSRLLAESGYHVETYLFNTKNSLSEDCQFNKSLLEEMPNVTFHEIINQFTPPTLTNEHLIIDGLFGTGLNKALSGGFAAVVKFINSSPATVVSIDIPSGLMGEDNTFNNPTHIIKANYTFSIQLPKLAFFFAENAEFLGEWSLVNIGLSIQGIIELPTNYYTLEHEEIKRLIKPRKKFSHKGTFGHAILIAGSQGMAGAAILAARSCMRSGVGLLTVHSPICNCSLLQTAIPEALVERDIQEQCFAEAVDTDDYQALGIGPGLGQSPETEAALLDQLNICNIPLVLDADALNILAQNRKALQKLPKGTILTPHPVELERLLGKCQNSFERLTKAAELARSTGVYIIVKGANSVIVTPTNSFYINTTGNPGMATAGSGDVLTGIILALLAQGYKPEEACKLGVYIHGMAGDMAAHRMGEICMNASDIITHLPPAFKMLTE